MSKKKEIREMASLIGNSAAHVALLSDDEYALKEAFTYAEDAAEIASSRTWSASDISEFKKSALRRAISEIKGRIERYGFQKNKIGEYVSRAEKYISLFAESHLEKRG